MLFRYPIPIHTLPVDVDYVLLGGRPCERLQYAYDKYHRSDKYKQEFDQFNELFQYLEKHSEVKIEDFANVARLYDTLSIEKQNNKT